MTQTQAEKLIKLHIKYRDSFIKEGGWSLVYKKSGKSYTYTAMHMMVEDHLAETAAKILASDTPKKKKAP